MVVADASLNHLVRGAYKYNQIGSRRERLGYFSAWRDDKNRSVPTFLYYTHHTVMKYLFYACLWLCCCLPFASQASHIVGGEMTYTCLGRNQYEISLTIFRDCENGNPAAYFDNPAPVGIFNARTGALIRTEYLFLPNDDTLNLTQSNPCQVITQDVCIHTTTYRRTVILPFSADGYHLVYQRCCRNRVISNIVSPASTGATYETVIGPTALSTCNSSPRFREWPPFYICQGTSIDYDHSATDLNGDSIVYGLYAPFQGGTDLDPAPDPPNSPPFFPVVWRTPYNTNNMLGGSDPFRIDPQTGRLSGTPTTLGIFVVGICAKEYRNGILIGITRRDFQYEVVACAPLRADFVATVPPCNNSLSIVHTNRTNTLSADFLWDFGDGSPLEQGVNIRHTYPDTGTYTVRLYASPGLPCADTTERTIRVTLDGADIEAPPAGACEGDTVLLVARNLLSNYNSITNYNWSPSSGILSGQGTDSVYLIMGSSSINLTVTATNNNNCIDVANTGANLEVVEASFDSIVFDCNSTLSIPFNNTSTMTNPDGGYVWDFGGLASSTLRNPRYLFPDTGRYVINLVAGIGAACQDTFTQVLDIPLNGALVLSTAPQRACFGDEVILSVQNALQDYNNITNYTWIPNAPLLSGQGTDSVRILANQSMVFRVAVTNDSGCVDTVVLPLQVFQINAAFSAAVPACNLSLSVPFINSSVDTTYPFIWDFGGTGTSTAIQPTHTFPDTGIYQVQLIGGIGSACPDTTVIPVEVRIDGIELDASDVQLVCYNDTAVLEVSNRWAGYNTITSYTWTPNTRILSGQGTERITVLAQADQTYTVTAINDAGCQDSTTALVNTSTLSPPLDIIAIPDSIFVGQRAQLLATDDVAYQYTWMPDTTLSSLVISTPFARPRQTTTYFLRVDNGNCINEDSITIVIRQPICGAPLIFVPNAFSPDGDGINDQVWVRGNNITEMSFLIYNRWGEKVFETNDQSQGWNGTFGGAALPPDVYGYYLRCTCDGGGTTLLKGNITLLK